MVGVKLLIYGFMTYEVAVNRKDARRTDFIMEVGRSLNA